MGPFGSDVLGLGDVLIPDVQFGLAEETNSTSGYAEGLMGVGYSQFEGGDSKYPNVPEVLRDAGVINSRLYSIYLNDANAGSGSILFGGVDTSKFVSPLETFDLLPHYHTFNITGVTPRVKSFVTTITALNVTVNGNNTSIFTGGSNSVSAFNSDSIAIAAFLDTGSTDWEVPAGYYDAIVKHLGYIDDEGACACSHRDSGDTLTLIFGEKLQITVPAREFIVPTYNATTRQPLNYDTAGNTLCELLLTRSTHAQGDFIVGEAILRSMYVVHDLDNGQVSLAQANVNSTQPANVIEIHAGPDGVASAVSGVSVIAPQTWSVDAGVSATQTFVASTATTTIGTATGKDALPTDARLVPASSQSTASGQAAVSPSKTASAAAGLNLPTFSIASSICVAWIALMAGSGAFILS